MVAMRLCLAILAVAGAWYFLHRPSRTPDADPRHASQPAPTVAEARESSASGNALKRPLDRAHAVTDMIHKQNAEEAF
jgi:hypothetical protein